MYQRPDDRLFGAVGEDVDDLSGEIASELVSPSIANELSGVGEELALLGLSEDDPNVMGSVLSQIVKNVKKGVKKVKKSGITGSFSISQRNRSRTPAPAPDSGFSPSGLLSNPAVLIGGVAVVGLVAFMLLKRKGRR